MDKYSCQIIIHEYIAGKMRKFQGQGEDSIYY